jgi:hypothetical protein
MYLVIFRTFRGGYSVIHRTSKINHRRICGEYKSLSPHAQTENARVAGIRHSHAGGFFDLWTCRTMIVDGK